MSKIALRRNHLLESSRIFQRPVLNFCQRGFSSNDKEKQDTPKDAPKDIPVIRKGILHDKQQSLQEESYFHKEEIQQLKALKQKFNEQKGKKDEEKKD